MPPRIARANVSVHAPKNIRNKNRKRNLDAYSIASHSAKDKRKVPQHRLGEILDDGPRQKRRKVDDEDEDGQDDDESAGDHAQKGPRRQRRPDDDGDVEEGSDSSGNEWTLGGLAENDDDSDLDSDEAFGESDEEKFEGFTFRGSSKGVRKPVKKASGSLAEDHEMDLSEGQTEDEEEDDFGGEGVDLATMLDDHNEELDEDDEEEGTDGEGTEISSSDGDDEDDGGGGALDEERLARMRDRLETMDEGIQSEDQPDNGEAGVISVDDLLADLDPVAKSHFQAAFNNNKKPSKSMTLTAPLPKRQQDKLNRELATAKAKEQLDRWRDTVMHNRRAEFLNFPLKDPNASEPLGKEKFIPAVPQTDLEQNIQRIMEESGMSAKSAQSAHDDAEAALLKAEELATNKLPIEDVERRRAELRRARELLFREEIKAKRIAKIKSKSYRRVHRKEREREAQKEREAAEAAGVILDENEADKYDKKRAEDRMSTKHRESKWAKSLKATNRTVWDESARDSVIDQAKRNEELKQRMAGKEVRNSDSSSDEEDEDDQSASVDLHQLKQLSERNDGTNDKGLAGMKFMRNADARRRAQNDEDVARMRKDLAIEDGGENSDSEIDDQGLGRAIFGPTPKEGRDIVPALTRSEFEEADDSEEEAKRREQAERGVGEVNSGARSGTPARKGILKTNDVDKAINAPASSREANKSVHAASNAWLDGTTDRKSKKDKSRRRDIGEDEIIAVDISAETPNASVRKSTKVNGAKTTSNDAATPNTDGWQTVPFSRHDSDDEGSEQDEVSISTGPKASLQSRAFAGDDVALAFQAEKEAAEASEDEKEISTHLPGWGSWTGENLSKSLRKANNRKKHNPLYKTKLPGGVNRENRKDKGRENVIISERTDRKGKKFLAPVLPHQYNNQPGGKDIYERSLRVPVGPEWSTKEVFQRNTRPRVVVQKGTVIEALEKPLV
nr:u3 small nucleolar rna-associated protein 14 [Quercus suber]